MQSAYDIAIIGSGSGGTEAALEAARRGARVVLIEKELLGGGAVHGGTIPMRSLIMSARTLRELRRAGDGDQEEAARLSDWVTRQRRTVARHTVKLHADLETAGVVILDGTARLLGGGGIHVTQQLPTGPFEVDLRAEHIILSTGARPAECEQAWPGSAISSSRKFMSLAEVPDRLVIIGGGHIGCEFACVYRALGAEVTILEKGARLLPEMDCEAGEYLCQEFIERGIHVRLGEEARAVWGGICGEFAVAGVLPDGEELFADKILLATGRVPNVQGLGLDEAGVRYDALRGIEVDDFLQTSAPGIFAIGDVNGLCTLADSARAQACIAIENALGARIPFPRNETPRCIHTDPPIASAGLLEQEARAAGRLVRAVSVRLRSSGAGLVKFIADPQTQQLLGGMIIGEHALKWIEPLAAAIRSRTKSADFPETFSEAGSDAPAILASLRDLCAAPRRNTRALNHPSVERAQQPL